MPVIRGITGTICLILFAAFAVTALSVFDWIPWHDDTGMSQMIMVVLWIPECAISVIHILLMLASGALYRARVMLICINALYIPLYYLIGVLQLSSYASLSAIAVCSVITTLFFAIAHFRSIGNKTV